MRHIDLCGLVFYYWIMEETGHFNRLAGELSVEERAKLLEKLSSQSSLAASVLYVDPKDQKEFVTETRYKNLPWYYKIWFSILSLFNSRPPLKLYEDHLMLQVYKDLEEQSPGFYNFQKDLLLPKFREELIKLRDGSRFFYHALDASFSRDKGGLLVFLGSLEMPNIHRQITADTDPESLSSRYNDMSEVEVRQKAVKAMEDALAGINEDERFRMYSNARSLFCLKQLASFLFDRLINSFTSDAGSRGHICSGASIREQLLSLNNILSSLKTAPSIALLESLFIYVLMEKGGEQGLDIQNEMRSLLVKAEISLQVIRDFNLEVPLTKLLRCISRNPGFVPVNIGGGEDWYTVFREQWKHQVEENFLNFSRTKHQRDLQNSFRYFLKGKNLRVLEHIGIDQNPSEINIRGGFCLSFLLTFYSVVFMSEINKYVRPILIDGEFIKKENRTEFTECYNDLITLEDKIKKLDMEISPSGDFGKRYLQAKNEMSSLPVKRRKIQMVVEEAVHEANQIIASTREALEGMINILGGILQKSPGGKYDTLVNLSVIAGRGTTFQNGLADSIRLCTKTLQLLDDIDIMEAGR